MWLFSGCAGHGMPARSDEPISARSSERTIAWRIVWSATRPAVVLNVMWRKFGPAAALTVAPGVVLAIWKPLGSGPMSNESSSLLAKLVGHASTLTTR